MTRETPIPDNIMEPLARLIARKLAAMLKHDLIKMAVDAAEYDLAVLNARLGLLPNREALHRAAAQRLRPLVDAEISRRIARHTKA